jgi:hypothetical protein
MVPDHPDQLKYSARAVPETVGVVWSGPHSQRVQKRAVTACQCAAGPQAARDTEAEGEIEATFNSWGPVDWSRSWIKGCSAQLAGEICEACRASILLT